MNNVKSFFPIHLSQIAFNKLWEIYCCRNELDSKELFNMARKLHGRKDPDRDSKAKQCIDWVTEMVTKPDLASIFCSK